jgi:hypothetical protein
MGQHLDATMKACSKAYAEAEKLKKQYDAAKTPQDKEKYKKMAEGAKKIGLAHFKMIDAAKQKDEAELLGIFKTMGV